MTQFTETGLISLGEANNNPDLPFSYQNRHKALDLVIETKVDPSTNYFYHPQRHRSKSKSDATFISHRSDSSFLVLCYGELWTLVHNNQIIRKKITKGECYTNLLYFNDYYYLYNMLQDRLEVLKYDNSEELKILPFKFRCHGLNEGLQVLPESDRYIVVRVRSESIKLFDTKRTKMGVLFKKDNEPDTFIENFFCVNKNTILLVQSLDLCLLSFVLDSKGKVKKKDKIWKFPIYHYLTKSSLPLSFQNLSPGIRPDLPNIPIFVSNQFIQEVGIFLTTSQKTGHTHLIKIQPKRKVKAVNLLGVVNLNSRKVSGTPKYYTFDFNILGVSKNKKIAVLQVGKNSTGTSKKTELRRLIFDLQRRKVLGRYSEVLEGGVPGMVSKVRRFTGWFCAVTGDGIRFMERVKI